jgi:hypothetical protein
MGISKYKYLVVSGCSQTQGQNCHRDRIWPKLLADRLGLELINLATPGAGWYTLENAILSFVSNNQNILNECFFILQQSMLERELDYNQISICPTDYHEKWNMKFVPKNMVRFLGYNNSENFGFDLPFQRNSDIDQVRDLYDGLDDYIKASKLGYFPEHRHYPNTRHFWKLGDNHDIDPPYIQEQFNELMLHWGYRMSSLHYLLKNKNVDHIMIDGYSPFLSYKLDFRNYYDTDDEFEMIKRFWSTKIDEEDEDEIMLYDFKNTTAGWIFDDIDSKYKIDDVVIWNLYMFKHLTSWNVDGGHAGPKGMELIEKVIYQNLQEKSWI